MAHRRLRVSRCHGGAGLRALLAGLLALYALLACLVGSWSGSAHLDEDALLASSTLPSPLTVYQAKAHDSLESSMFLTTDGHHARYLRGDGVETVVHSPGADSESSSLDAIPPTRLFASDDATQESSVSGSSVMIDHGDDTTVTPNDPIVSYSALNVRGRKELAGRAPFLDPRGPVNEKLLHDLYGDPEFDLMANRNTGLRFIRETEEEFEVRMRKWEDNVTISSRAARHGYYVSPRHLQFIPDTEFALRTAIRLFPSRIFLIPMIIPRQHHRNSTYVTGCSPRCSCRQTESIKLECEMGRGTGMSEEEVRAVRYLNVTFSHRHHIAVPVEDVRRDFALDSDDTVELKEIQEDDNQTTTRRIPSPPPEPTLSVCLQGVIWQDEVVGAIPDEVVRTWIGHYARLGASQIHIYTRNGEFLDKVGRLPPLCRRGTVDADDDASRDSSSWCRTKVILHDTPIPRYSVPKHLIDSSSRKFQHFVIQDCITRSMAAGATWTLVVDMDEYVFPSSSDHSTLARAFEESSKGITWWYLPSYIMHTVICAPHPRNESVMPDGFRRLLDHVAFAKMDRNTYKGRRKYALRRPRAPWGESILNRPPPSRHVSAANRNVNVRSRNLGDYLENQLLEERRGEAMSLHNRMTSPDEERAYAVWSQVAGYKVETHDASFSRGGVVMDLTASPPAHIHHLRDNFHSRVCSEVMQPGAEGINITLGGEFFLHRPQHEVALRRIEEVFE